MIVQASKLISGHDFLRITKSDADKAVVREYYRALDAHDADAMMAVLHADLIWTMVGVGELTTESTLPVAQGFCAAFQDMNHTLNEQTGEGNAVTTQLTFTGTHNGDLMVIPPNGKPLRCAT